MVATEKYSGKKVILLGKKRSLMGERQVKNPAEQADPTKSRFLKKKFILKGIFSGNLLHMCLWDWRTSSRSGSFFPHPLIGGSGDRIWEDYQVKAGSTFLPAV